MGENVTKIEKNVCKCSIKTIPIIVCHYVDMPDNASAQEKLKNIKSLQSSLIRSVSLQNKMIGANISKTKADH